MAHCIGVARVLGSHRPPCKAALQPVEQIMMMKLQTTARAFARSEDAATAVEYGLITASIAVAIITVLNGIGSSLNTTFTSISTALK